MKVNTAEYLNTMKELIEQGETVPVPVAGISMRPFLSHHKDTVMIQKPSSPLKKGDIVLYQRIDQQFVLHRILKVNPNHTYDIIGDAQCVIEHNVPRSQIIGIAIQAERNGKWITPKNIIWKYYSKVWIHTISLRKLYLFFRKKF